MELTVLWVSVIVNAILVTVVLYGAVENRRTRNHLFRKDGYIRDTKTKLLEAQQEIQRKESVILKEKGKGRWTIQFFAEEQVSKGFFKDKWTVRYRFQLLLNGFPVGPSGIVSEEIYSEIDKGQVNQILQNFAKPIMDAGIQVAVRSLV